MHCQFFQEGTPLRPIVSSMNTPTTGISKFLDRLIRPLFDQHVRATTIIDGVDLIRRLDTYIENNSQTNNSAVYIRYHRFVYYVTSRRIIGHSHRVSPSTWLQ